VRRSTPASSRCVAKLWRRVWGVRIFLMPESKRACLQTLLYRIDGQVFPLPACEQPVDRPIPPPVVAQVSSSFEESMT